MTLEWEKRLEFRIFKPAEVLDFMRSRGRRPAGRLASGRRTFHLPDEIEGDGVPKAWIPFAEFSLPDASDWSNAITAGLVFFNNDADHLFEVLQETEN